MSDQAIEPETQSDQRGNAELYEPVNTQLEVSATVQEAEHSAQHENRVVEVKGKAFYDNQRHYENAAFDNQNKTVNVYEGLQIRTDNHAYADLENN